MSTQSEEAFEIRNRQLSALHEAAVSIAGELSPDKVLQQIVDAARELACAEYAALGVPSSEGYLEAFIHSGMSQAQVDQMAHPPQGLGLLGVLIQDKTSIRRTHIEQDGRSVGFPAGHPAMDSFLGVPILAGDTVLGNLYLTNKQGAAAFSAEDQKLVEMLAAHAAVAIQNARLYEQVGRLAIVEERTRIGMDLHDGTIQSIYAVGLTLESVKMALPAGANEAMALLEQATTLLNDSIRDIRNYILDLRPRRFQGNLEAGLARLVREFQANTMVAVTLEADSDLLANLPTPLARTFFLTTQEALANVARHARAQQVWVSLTAVPQAVRLKVKDNGQGFDPTDTQTHTVGHGLSNMQARAEELGGTFDIHAAPGRGTTITLTLPQKR